MTLGTGLNWPSHCCVLEEVSDSSRAGSRLGR
jgi:hypothetical protein